MGSKDYSVNNSAAESTSILDSRQRRLRTLLHKYRHAYRIQQALLQLSELASTARDLPSFYHAIHDVIRTLISAENLIIALKDVYSHSLSLVYFVDEFDQKTLPYIDDDALSNGLLGYVFRTGCSLSCDKQALYQLVTQHNISIMGTPAEHWLGVPIRRQQHIIGVIAVQNYQPAFRYHDEQLELLEFIALHLATAIDRIEHRERLNQEVENRTAVLSELNLKLSKEVQERRRAEHLYATLHAISELSAQQSSQQQFYHQLHQELSKITCAENMFIALVDHDKQELHFPYMVNKNIEQPPKSRPFAKGYTEYVIRQGKPVVLSLDQAKQLLQQGELEAKAPHVGITAHCTSWMGAPLIVGNQLLGVMALQAYNNNYHYSDHDIQAIAAVAHQVANTIARRNAHEALQEHLSLLELRVEDKTKALSDRNDMLRREIEKSRMMQDKLYHEAHHDPLTGLANRAAFLDRMNIALQQSQRNNRLNFAVLFIDLDHFKPINDSFGHQVGDEFLIAVAERLATCCRANDLLARVGGDEFVLLLDMFDRSDTPEEVAKRVLKTLGEPIYLQGHSVFSGASIGVNPSFAGYQNTDDIIRDADCAMYQAKAEGRNRFVIFNHSMRAKRLQELSLENALQQAIAQRDFTIQNRAIMAGNGQHLVGSWLQLSWFYQAKQQHFSSVELEQLGLPASSDKFILEALAKMPVTGRYFVQLNSRHLVSHSSLSQLMTRLAALPHHPEQLVLAFQETTLARLESFALSALLKLRKLGYKLAVTGYGAGLCSFSLLTQARPDYVSLDNKFVRSMIASEENQHLLKSLSDICQTLKLNLVAQGVDLAAQVDLLQQLDIPFCCGRWVDNKWPDPAITLAALDHLA